MDAFVQTTFSIAVAAFLLLRMEREMRALREAIDKLRYCQICRFSDIVAVDVIDCLSGEEDEL